MRIYLYTYIRYMCIVLILLIFTYVHTSGYIYTHTYDICVYKLYTFYVLQSYLRSPPEYGLVMLAPSERASPEKRPAHSLDFRGLFPVLEMILMAVAPQCETLPQGCYSTWLHRWRRVKRRQAAFLCSFNEWKTLDLPS